MKCNNSYDKYYPSDYEGLERVHAKTMVIQVKQKKQGGGASFNHDRTDRLFKRRFLVGVCAAGAPQSKRALLGVKCASSSSPSLLKQSKRRQCVKSPVTVRSGRLILALVLVRSSNRVLPGMIS